ncbi:MAG: 50S ribosomal protein L24 [Candidatus Omnitrophica bacterium]|nr:50S ribosomal protein L24 [Candidatus Omnitrophota bacterium]
MLGLKKNDNVYVIAGKDKGKTGKILNILTSKQKAIVEGINMVKKARRKRSQQDQQSGIISIEAPIHLSNLMLVDKKSGKPTRFGVEILKDGTKVRISKESGEVI